MSSNTRATSKGGKGAKTDKSHKSEKSESGKGGGDKQHRDGNSKSEELSIKDKVKILIEMTQRSEEEVCLALHECDYDVNTAINTLFETGSTGEWETRVKKKKKQPAAAGAKQEGGKPEDNPAAVDDWNDPAGPVPSGGGGGAQGGGNDRRNRSGGPPRQHGGRGGNDGGGGGRGWRGRERHENERNLEEGGGGGGGYRGRGGRSGVAGRGGRGRGGGRTGGGRYQPRGNRSNIYNKPIETWDNSNTWDNNTAVNSNHNAEESWDDFPGADEWSTEEYQGSLADTKVFTPSVQTVPDPVTMSEPPGLNDQPQLDNQQLVPQLQPASQSPVPQMVGTLTAAQTQYFSQLQQNNDPLTKQYSQQTQSYQTQTYEKPANIPAATQQYSPATVQSYQSAYNVVTGTSPSGYQQQTYSNTPTNQEQVVVAQQQPQQPTAHHRTKTQRARVPPPSKIPSSAVEMPGELNSSIGYLDVQFGAMDLIDSNSSFDSSIDGNKYSTTQQTNNLEASSVSTTSNLDLNSSGQNGANNLDGYSPKASNQGSISSALSQSLSSADTIPPTSADHLSNTYTGSSNRSSATVPSTASSAAASTPLELSKQSQQESHSSYSQPSTYNSYQAKSNAGYNSSSYSGGTQTTASSYVSNQAASYVNSQSSAGYPSGGGNSYQNAYSSNSSYQTGNSVASTGFSSMNQANAYPSNNQSYPQNASQSVYGANAGLSNNTSYNPSAAPYNNYSGQHKLSKDGAYDNSTTNSGQAATSVTSSAALSLSQTTSGGSKTSTTLAKNSNSIVSNIPPGVTPVMSTPYIMGQVPYFQQPVYSYEEMQMLQQRLPHLTTPFYDMSYQTTPTTLATVRDATLGNVGYTIGGDARYVAAAAAAAAGRTDNSASPSPSSTLGVGGQGGGTGLSSGQGQQQQAVAAAQQQPLMAGAAPAPYFFATAAFNALAPNYQFGTMYTQLPAATNAHGSSNSTQYPKPAGYNTGYGAYDALGQTQDYSKGGYVGTAGQGQKGGANTTSAGGSTSAGNDLSAMYAKSHTALGKVNSYEKQGFHSGTPPPFTGALHGNQNAGLAPSGAGYPPVYIPAMAPHQQHHSTHMMQQPLHQMDVRHQGRRVDSGNAGGQRSQTSNQTKAGAKQTYQTSYWNPA